MQKVCSICSIEFEAKRKDVIYCSNKCKRTAEYNSRPFVHKVCLNCVKNYETQNKKSLYCSTACSNTHSKTHDDVELSCKECNKPFVRKYTHRDKLFCSRSCATIHQNNIMFSNDKVRNKISETKKQQYASGEVVHPFLGKNLTAEHKQKLSDFKIKEGKWKGENNPAYGGQSEEIKQKMSKTRAERIQNGTIRLSKGQTVFFKKANKEVFARSSWEKDFMEKLDNDNIILSAIFEPFVVMYRYAQKQRHYIPDLLILYKDGTKKLIEIKPSCFLDAEINKCKFSAAQKYCDEKGMTFEVWTEKSNPYLA